VHKAELRPDRPREMWVLQADDERGSPAGARCARQTRHRPRGTRRARRRARIGRRGGLAPHLGRRRATRQHHPARPGPLTCPSPTTREAAGVMGYAGGVTRVALTSRFYGSGPMREFLPMPAPLNNIKIEGDQPKTQGVLAHYIRSRNRRRHQTPTDILQLIDFNIA